ncbi:phage tail protein [Thalassospira sp.]|uniref:phage tail protein n=1 Tax=Thalassospira sp. TaxID=1912094 RepID=UPI001B2708C7|nr:phage tail protein [Thalassospira sp.]MBO6808843.1 tail fiber protein [Thalassospira sp.]MBO6840792.1 tail fiber protein [Thalassospira sp.]
MQCLSPVESEVLNVVLAADIQPDRLDDTQLLQAINALISGGGSGGSGVVAGSEIGSVSAFAMPTPPTGWLVCDGSAISRTEYADLFATIGTLWGHGDEVTTFNLPDLRGEFVRGFDDGRGVDDGRAFGSAQSDEFKSHYHGFVNQLGAQDAGNDGYITTGDDPVDQSLANSVTDNAGGDETRPRNIAMTYAIKAFYPSAS